MPVGSTGTPNVNPASGGLTPVSGPNLPPNNKSKYTPKDLVILAHAAGFSNPAMMAAVSMAEDTSGDPKAIGQDNNGTHDVGLWQINSSHGYPDSLMEDPYYNVAAAKVIYDSQGYGAWSTVRFKPGEVATNYYTTEPIAVGLNYKLTDSGSLGGDTVGGLVNSVAPIGQAAASGLSSLVSPFTKILGELTSGSFWIMVLKILAGVALIGVGLYMLVKNG